MWDDEDATWREVGGGLVVLIRVGSRAKSSDNQGAFSSWNDRADSAVSTVSAKSGL